MNQKWGISMLTCFSTLACPDFSWQDIYSMAKDFGFDGIEIRGLGDDIFSVKAPPFRENELPKTVAKLKQLKLQIPVFLRVNPSIMRLQGSRRYRRSLLTASLQARSEQAISESLPTAMLRRERK